MRSPNPVVSMLEISWTSRELEDLDGTNREIEDDMIEPGDTLESMEKRKSTP
jgi:hypothetical protein